MILNIRGTGGSGKSTVVRAVMERFPYRSPEDSIGFDMPIGPQFVDGRKQPIGYVRGRLDGDGRPMKRLYVVGHYETPCGGGDTMKTPAEVFDAARRAADAGMDAIFEGIISQDDVKRTAELSRAHRLVVLCFSTPLKDCLAGIQARRDARGDVRPLDPRNTEARFRSVRTRADKLRAAGVEVRWVSRDEALDACMNLLAER